MEVDAPNVVPPKPPIPPILPSPRATIEKGSQAMLGESDGAFFAEWREEVWRQLRNLGQVVSTLQQTIATLNAEVTELRAWRANAPKAANMWISLLVAIGALVSSFGCGGCALLVTLMGAIASWIGILVALHIL